MSFQKAVLGLIFSSVPSLQLHQIFQCHSFHQFHCFHSINFIILLFVNALIRDWHKCQPLIYFSLRPRVSDLVDSGRQGKGYFTCRLLWVN